MRKLRIIVYGLFPAIISIGNPNVLDQVSEYPEWVELHQNFVTDLIVSVYGYIHLIRFEFVSLDTLKGLYYALRYRLGNNPAIIIDGRVFKPGRDKISVIKEYVLERLRVRRLI